jgi:thiamine biosynthesis lipoprotein ApbE
LALTLEQDEPVGSSAVLVTFQALTVSVWTVKIDFGSVAEGWVVTTLIVMLKATRFKIHLPVAVSGVAFHAKGAEAA